ncbi:3206_t:CDS:2 [Dentiscutata erythropus]|uniref:3206_t:CDS:1 n=1 Tax=Dentiscutata erythropus TaxID=1348616 RepID=A0A9N9NUP8_9GLOM|nr:3206_t:CDS:2 [Dentiscutata erythropus]
MPPNNPNFTGQIPHNNQVPANIPAQNFTRQNVTQNPMPIHNLPGKNHLSQQQPVVVNNLGQNLNQQPFTGNYNQPRGYPQTNQNHIALKSAPVIPIVNQRSIPPKPAALSGGQQINHGNSIQYLNTNPNPIPSNINNIGPGPGGNPTVNVQGNPQSRQNTYTHTQPIHSNMPQNFQPPNGVNLGPSGQNATGFIQQNHNIVPNSGMQTPGAAPNSGRQTPVTLNSGGGKPPNSGGQPPNSGGQPPNSGGQPPNTTPIQTPNAPNSGSKQFPFPNGNSAYLTSVINIKCPMIQQCIEVKERYKKEFGTVLGYEDTEECHTGYHAGFGDVVGLRHHFYYGAKVNGDSLFTNTRENLVIIAARYCSRRKLIEIFKLLKEYNANFKRVSNSTGKTPLHCLYENTSFAKDLNDHKGLQKFHKYMKEAIEFLVDNGCNINAMDHGRQTLLSYYLSDRFRHKETTPIILTLLKKGADPNIPSKVTIASYNAPNALFLAVKIGWSIEVLDALLNRGARVDIKDDNGDNLLVLAAKEKQSDSKKPFDTINWILETIPEASTRDCVEAAMKILDRKYRNKLSKWKGSDGESRRRLVQENLELKKQLRTETESSKEQESVSD